MTSGLDGACRAKAGGKQSSKDASGKFAKSAGSQIRRYNEVKILAAREAALYQIAVQAVTGKLCQEGFSI